MQLKLPHFKIAEFGILSLFIVILALAGCGGGPLVGSCGGCYAPISFGGSVTNLITGNNVVLQLQHSTYSASATISTNGPYIVENTTIGSPYSYSMVVASQPTTQSCSIANGTGIAYPSTSVGNILVDCSGSKYNVGVIITGNEVPEGSLILQNNGSDDLRYARNNITSNFNTPLSNGAAYSVTVLTQPPGQTCSVMNGNGVVNGASVIIGITCI